MTNPRLQLLFILHSLLSCILFQKIVLSEQTKICAIQKISYKDTQCQNVLSSQSINVIDGNNNGTPDCHLIEDGLYKLSCNNGFDNNNLVTLLPCFDTNIFLTSQEREMNICYPTQSGNSGNEVKSYKFHGSCQSVIDSSTCSTITFETLYPTDHPSDSPSTEPAAIVTLPSPPLARNEFADGTILDVDVAYESVYLAGRFIYSVLTADEAEQNLPASYTFHSFYDKGSTEAMVITSDHSLSNDGKILKRGKIIVVFRGTDDTPDGDWLTDLDLPLVKFGPKDAIICGKVKAPGYFGLDQMYDIRVHRGFNGVFSDNLYEDILNDINPLLQRTMDGDNQQLYYNNTIYFYGHSLGGANAQLFATYYAFFHEDIKTHVVSLGAPRQGNYGYKILVESIQNLSVWRLVNCRDVVPRTPMFQYYHAGHLMWKRCDPPDSNSGLSNDVVEAYYRGTGDLEQGLLAVPQEFIIRSYEQTLFSDHFGAEYLEWIEYARGNGKNKNWTTYFQSENNITATFVTR